MWLIIRNNRDYLNPVKRKPGLFVRRTGRAIFEYQCVSVEVPLAEINNCV